MAVNGKHTKLVLSDQPISVDEYLLASMWRLTYVAAITGIDNIYSIAINAAVKTRLILRRARSSAG